MNKYIISSDEIVIVPYGEEVLSSYKIFSCEKKAKKLFSKLVNLIGEGSVSLKTFKNEKLFKCRTKFLNNQKRVIDDKN